MQATGMTTVTETAALGLRQATERLQGAGEQVAQGKVDPAVIVNISLAEYQFAANATVLKTAQRMMGRLLDAVA